MTVKSLWTYWHLDTNFCWSIYNFDTSKKQSIWRRKCKLCLLTYKNSEHSKARRTLILLWIYLEGWFTVKYLKLQNCSTFSVRKVWCREQHLHEQLNWSVYLFDALFNWLFKWNFRYVASTPLQNVIYWQNHWITVSIICSNHTEVLR